MARLPDGWIIFPKVKSRLEIELVPHELVRCKNCKHYFRDDNGHVVVYRCELNHEDMREDFYCADGERRESE